MQTDKIKQILFQLQHRFWTYKIFGKNLDDGYYFIKNWISPYNVIKLRALDRDWHDTDEKMFHAVFELLCQYIENEHPFSGFNNTTQYNKDNVVGMRKTLDDWLGPEGECAKEDSGYGGIYPKSQYLAGLEALDLYDWYCNHYEKEKIALEEAIHTIQYPDRQLKKSCGQTVNKDLKSISPEEYWKMEEDFDKRCDDQMIRCVVARRSMWT